MNVVAIYNMKGGVGKTTTAVNLSYLAAAAGHRTLLWDLDPQAASSFAFRIRPHVAGFDRKSVKNGRAFVDAIKATDYGNLDLLPADFAYRKMDRILSDLHKPRRTLGTLLQILGEDYDVVFLDCPAGFSLLIEGVFAAAEHVLVPTIPTILSLRTLARLLKCAERSRSTPRVSAFFSMVDSRKALHRRACGWSAEHAELFLTTQIPYASIVEQMAVRRMPLPVFAPRDPAAAAFAQIWGELLGRSAEGPMWGRASAFAEATADSPKPWRRLSALRPGSRPAAVPWATMLTAVESLISRLEAADVPQTAPRPRSATQPVDMPYVHAFDTERRDLERCGCILELLEQSGAYFLIAGPAGVEPDRPHGREAARVQIDSRWARDILSGTMSPVAALEHRLGRVVQVEAIRVAVAKQPLARINSRIGGREPWSEQAIAANGATTG